MKLKIYPLAVLLILAFSSNATEVTNSALMKTRVEVALITNSASITTNLFFYFTAGTNYLDHSKFLSGDLIRYTILNRDKKPELFRVFPARQAFDFKLTDASGRLVTKTKLGLLWGQPIGIPKSTREATRLNPRPAGETYFLFRPDDLFVLTNKGIYDLEAKLTIWAQTTNNVNDIEIWSIKNPKGNIRYGVVVSEPLHVKIIKE